MAFQNSLSLVFLELRFSSFYNVCRLNKRKNMNDILLLIWLRFKEMPFFLRIITAASPLGPLVGILSLIPLVTYRINDQVVTYREFWRSGAAFNAILIGLTFSVIGGGIFMRSQWVRKLILALVVVQDVLLLRQLPEAGSEKIPESIGAVAIYTAIVIWYIFFKKSVRNYFKSGSAAQQPDERQPNTL
ncbi:MAG: hypothetical protein WC291_10925 [Thermodesulfovibrionales bacterium]|jgi:hypothetical protein